MVIILTFLELDKVALPGMASVAEGAKFFKVFSPRKSLVV